MAPPNQTPNPVKDLLSIVSQWAQVIMLPIVAYFVTMVLNNDKRLTVEETTRTLEIQSRKDDIARLEKALEKLGAHLAFPQPYGYNLSIPAPQAPSAPMAGEDSTPVPDSIISELPKEVEP